MAFVAKGAGKTASTTTFENRNFPTPKAGARKARISLIVDLGTQEREDFEDPNTKEKKPQKPCQQVAVFADLVADTVDYGGDIGKQHYRLLLNKSFAGQVEGVNFTTVPPKDKDGKIVEGKPWTLHPANLLTKLAKAIEKPEIITTTDIEQLLGEPFIADVEVNEKDSGKEDKDGNPIIYKNVNFKGASKVPMVGTGEEDEDGNEIEAPQVIADLRMAPRLVSFDDATKEDIKFIRGNLLKMIKLATNYAGSNMQKAIEAFEAEQAEKAKDGGKGAAKEKPAAKKTATKAKAPADTSDMDDDVPF